MAWKQTALLSIVLLAGVIGCGEGGKGNDEAVAVEDVILGTTLSHDPADCRRYYTQDFLERMAFGPKGELALRFCEEVAASSTGRYPDEVTVFEVEIDDREATAEASMVGGTLDGQSVAFELVKEGEQWKLDYMVEFTEFNRARLLEGMKLEVEEGVELAGIEPAVGDCVVERFERLEDEELQELVLYQDPEGVPGIFQDCLRQAGGTQDI